MKRGGGKCPMKPGNQHCMMKRCQITQSLTLRDERTVQHKCVKTFLLVVVERFFVFSLQNESTHTKKCVLKITN